MPRSIAFAAGLLAIVLGAILLIIWVFNAQPADAPAFGVLIAVPLVLALGAAFVGERYGLWRRFRHIGVALFVVYAIGAALILITMLTTTSLMFISAHDASVAVVITLYATGVTLLFGNFVVNSLSDGISLISQAAEHVRAGDLSVRASELGNDEIAQLARTFNQMTGQLRQARDSELQINQARRDWIAWVSHDLRTPLTSLRARAEALSDGVVARPDEVAGYLAAIRNDANTLNRLIDDLSELARIDAGGLKLALEEVNIGDLVSDTVESLKVLAEERLITLSGAADADVPVSIVSPRHIQRVLNNLTGNALAHCVPGGHVHIHVMRQAAGVRVSIADDGEGIAPADLPHVFERFYRGEKSRKREKSSGMGLGLVIARELVEAHGGAIGIESTPGAGATAWFTLL